MIKKFLLGFLFPIGVLFVCGLIIGIPMYISSKLGFSPNEGMIGVIVLMCLITGILNINSVEDE